METNNLQAQKGFTLVEIAIVLVIIGLLLGGVLKGQELITNSKLDSVKQDFNGITAAYYAYENRMGQLPGDGDDNGLVDNSGNFWRDLRDQGLIKGEAGDGGAASHALNGEFTIHSTELSNAQGGFTNNHICANNIDTEYAKGMDKKLDDNDYQTGNYRGTTGYTSTGPMTICKEL